MTLNKDKYIQTVLYFCSKLGGEVRGKKKMAKLLYFADFDFFEKTQKSITGDIYKAYPKGPLQDALSEITRIMKKDGILKIDNIKEWGEEYAPTEIYKSVGNPNLAVFDIDEIKMLNRVIKKYGALNGEQLAELSHAEAPYTAAELYQELPYDLTYYRGTDFSDL